MFRCLNRKFLIDNFLNFFRWFIITLSLRLLKQYSFCPILPFFIIILVKVQKQSHVLGLEAFNTLFVDYYKDCSHQLADHISTVFGVHEMVLGNFSLINDITQIFLKERSWIFFGELLDFIFDFTCFIHNFFEPIISSFLRWLNFGA